MAQPSHFQTRFPGRLMSPQKEQVEARVTRTDAVRAKSVPRSFSSLVRLTAVWAAQR